MIRIAMNLFKLSDAGDVQSAAVFLLSGGKFRRFWEVAQRQRRGGIASCSAAWPGAGRVGRRLGEIARLLDRNS